MNEYYAFCLLESNYLYYPVALFIQLGTTIGHFFVLQWTHAIQMQAEMSYHVSACAMRLTVITASVGYCLVETVFGGQLWFHGDLNS